MGFFTCGYHSKSWKKKSLSRSVVNREATMDGILVHGSKDETFFDTMESLASDWDDDFYSVKGDSTPICEDTPKSRVSTSIPDQSNKDPPIDSSSPKSECLLRKKLSTFLQEESADDEVDVMPTDNGNLDDKEKKESTRKGIEHPPKPSGAATGENSTGSIKESMPQGSARGGKSKSPRRMNCCIPHCSRRTKSVESVE